MSSSSSKSQQTTVNETRQINVQGIEGIAVAGNEGAVSVNVTDGGAFKVASDALAANVDAVAANATVSVRAIEAAEAQGREGLVIAEKATRNALDFATNATRPEGGQTVDVVKWGSIAAAAVAAAMILRK